jgi:hypothetical protein
MIAALLVTAPVALEAPPAGLVEADATLGIFI